MRIEKFGAMHKWRLLNFRDFGPPPSPCQKFWQICSTKITQPPLLRQILTDPLPPPTADVICACPLKLMTYFQYFKVMRGLLGCCRWLHIARTLIGNAFTFKQSNILLTKKIDIDTCQKQYIFKWQKENAAPFRNKFTPLFFSSLLSVCLPGNKRPCS